MLRPFAPILLVLLACGSDPGKTSKDSFLFRTDAFTLKPGEEKFLCYAKTLEEDLVIDRFDYEKRALVHHFLLAQTTAPEKDGLSECDVLFRPTWAPIFGAATASTSLAMPEGVGLELAKGTQILIQLHLLNTGTQEASDSAEIHLHRSNRTGLDSVGLYAFGRTELELPPMRVSDSVNTCDVPEDVEVFAVLPHMHYLGKVLKFEVGDSDATMKEVYRREPWSFDDQYIELKSIQIQKGSRTRVTCTFENPYDHTVGFGESSKDEMCFLVTFARRKKGLSGCVGIPEVPLVPRDPAAGECGMQTANDKGIGAKCTKGGQECAGGLICSLDQAQADPNSPGFCLQLGGCKSTSECGSGATCCAPAEIGGLLNICIPEACRPENCSPK